MDILKTPTSILEEDINNLFKNKSSNDIEILFSIISLILFKNSKNTDMIDLYNNFDLDVFIKMVNLFSGRTVHFSEYSDLKETLVLSICYFLREIEGERDWEKVQSFFGSYKIDRLSIALKIHNLDEWVKQKISEQMKQLLKEERNEK